MYIPKTEQGRDISVITEDTELMKVPNPYYVFGTKRKVLEFLLDINPSGQAVQLAALELSRPGAVIIYDAALTALFCSLGVFIFKKRNLK